MEQCLQCCLGGFLINVPIMQKDLLLNRDIANFQGEKCTFAPIYLKISAMEGEIFLTLLIFGTISTMVSRRIFDKCANYVERFVIISGYSEFSRWKMYICTNLTQNLCGGGWNILGIFNLWNNVYNGVVADFW